MRQAPPSRLLRKEATASTMFWRIESSFFCVWIPAGGDFQFLPIGFALPDVRRKLLVVRGGSEAAELAQRGVLHGLRDEWEGREDVGEFRFGQVVEVRDHAVEFGAELCAFFRCGRGCGVVSESDASCEFVKLRRGADETRGARDNRRKLAVAFGQARDGNTVNEEEREMICDTTT